MLVEYLTHSQLWKQRNGARHGTDYEQQQMHARQNLQQELKELHEQKHLLQQEDQHIFRQSVEDHLTEPLHRIRNWLSSYRPLIRHSLMAATKASQLGMTPLTRIFRRKQHKQKQKQHQTKRKAVASMRELKDTHITGYFTNATAQRRDKRTLRKDLDRNAHSNHPG